MLQFRANVMQKIRNFFIERGYLELDTPALASCLIPETCLEVFKTEYIQPWKDKRQELYLVPSPEVHIKPIIARHKVSVFQLSKCYRNVESKGRLHSPEFTMLEYYTMNATYLDSAKITEELFSYILPAQKNGQKDFFSHLRPPFIRLAMDDAFTQYAGFRLSECPNATDLALHAKRLGLVEPQNNPFNNWDWDDLYELIFVQCVEPNLPQEKPVFLMDYPAQVPCLAQDVPSKDGKPVWKERWELYAQGIELSNCYSEETDPHKVRLYFEDESKKKEKNARVFHATNKDYWKHFKDFPKCSGNAMGVDRLVALLSGRTSIDGVLPQEHLVSRH